jgi:hypothetical protein
LQSCGPPTPGFARSTRPKQASALAELDGRFRQAADDRANLPGQGMQRISRPGGKPDAFNTDPFTERCFLSVSLGPLLLPRGPLPRHSTKKGPTSLHLETSSSHPTHLSGLLVLRLNHSSSKSAKQTRTKADKPPAVAGPASQVLNPADVSELLLQNKKPSSSSGVARVQLRSTSRTFP